MRRTHIGITALGLLLVVSAAFVFAAPHPMEPQPDHVKTPVGLPPSDAIVLFDGTDMSNWTHTDGTSCAWTVRDGAFEVRSGKGGIVSTREFSDIQLHLEFATPSEVKGDGQGRGNSGIYFCGLYEVQVLDSYQNETYINGMLGAIYENFSPLVNAARVPGEWQTYDIIFRSPKLDSKGRIMQKANLTVLLNGVLIQDHVYTSPTPGGIQEMDADKGPIFIQDHSNPVRYRNIWVRELE